MNRLIINTRESERRFVLLKNGKVCYLYIEQPEQKSHIGNIYLGIVERIVPHLHAAFVRLGKEQKGYLSFHDVPRSITNTGKVHAGEKIIVQIKKDETERKSYRITANIEFSGSSLVYMPYGNYTAVSKKIAEPERTELKNWAEAVKKETEGILVRTKAAEMSKEKLVEQLNALREKFVLVKRKGETAKAPALLMEKDSFMEEITRVLAKEQVEEIFCDQFNFVEKLKQEAGFRLPVIYYNEKENIFSHFRLHKDLETVFKKVVWLPNGANIVIEEREAFTVIDVNSAKFSGRIEREDFIETTNEAAAKEIARQIKLRNIGGNIFVDFINMRNSKARKRIIQILQNEFADDYERVIIYGFTSLGVLEMSRKRERPSLQQKMTQSCSVCGGTGVVGSPASVAFQLERELWGYKGGDYKDVYIEVSEDVYQYFTGKNKHHVKNLEETLNLSLHFKSVTAAKPCYRILRLSY